MFYVAYNQILVTTVEALLHERLEICPLLDGSILKLVDHHIEDARADFFVDERHRAIVYQLAKQAIKVAERVFVLGFRYFFYAFVEVSQKRYRIEVFENQIGGIIFYKGCAKIVVKV